MWCSAPVGYGDLSMQCAAQVGLLKYAKLNVVARKRSGRPKKTLDKVLVDDRKKLGMESTGSESF